MTATKTITKPVAKTVSKASTKPVKVSKAKAAPATLFYAATLAEALTGKFGKVIQRFYVNACQYHLKQATVFPRGRLAGQPLLNEKDALEFITKHAVTSIPAGSLTGQRLFDEMMVQTASKPKAAPAAAAK